MKAKNLLVVPMMFTFASCNQDNIDFHPSTKKTSEQYTTKKEANETDPAYAEKLARVGEILITNPVGVTMPTIFSRKHSL